MTGRMFAHALGNTIGENHQMQMAVKAHEWTRADLERLPDDGNRYEVVRGELFVTPAPSIGHEDLVYVLAGHLRRYAEPRRLGEVRQGPNAMVFEGSEVQPDIMVRTRPVPSPEKWEDMPTPFLVVEILSGATRRRDLVAKRSLYLDAGVGEYWVVDGRARSIRVVRRDFDQVVTETLSWHPSGATEALVLDVVDVFREALGNLDR